MDISRGRSLAWTLTHVVFFACTALLVKLSSAQLAVATMLFARSAVSLVVLLISSPQAIKASLTSRSRGLLLTRGVLGFAGTFGTFYSLTVLPIPIAMMIAGATPILVILFGAVLLGERIKAEIVLYTALVAASIYFVTRAPAPPHVEHLSPFAVLVAAASAIATALAFITVRAAVKKTGTTSVVFWFAACSLVGSAALGGFPTELLGPPTRLHLYVLLICLFGIASDLTKTNAYKYGEAWFVSLVSVLTIAVSGALSWAVFGETVSLTQWLGIAAMMVFLVIAILRSRPAPPRSAPAPTAGSPISTVPSHGA